MVAKKDLNGMKFGTLQVIQPAGSNKDGRALWLVRCVCGEERIALGKDLGKKVTRCRSKCVLKEDLSGQIFGNLKVVKRIGSDKHGFDRFLCVCINPIGIESVTFGSNSSAEHVAICGKKVQVN